VPLNRGKSKEAIQANISKLVDEGYSVEQAVAIAMQKAGKGLNERLKKGMEEERVIRIKDRRKK